MGCLGGGGAGPNSFSLEEGIMSRSVEKEKKREERSNHEHICNRHRHKHRKQRSAVDDDVAVEPDSVE